MGHILLEKGDEDVNELVDWFLKKEIKIKGDWAINKKKKLLEVGHSNSIMIFTLM